MTKAPITSLPSELKHYLDGDFQQISGACNPNVFYSILLLDFCQKKEGFDTGSIAEIGVRDGKFFIGLNKTYHSDEKCLAIDIFDQQHFNIDGSGFRPASYGVPFFENSERLLGKDKVDCVSRDTLSLNLADVVDISKRHKPFRFFSIDGGHQCEHVTNDLRIAENMTSSGGVIALDDYYNPNFPGVHEGFIHYMLGFPKFVPIMYSHGKLMLVNKTLYHKFFATLLNLRESTSMHRVFNKVKLTGYDIFHYAV